MISVICRKFFKKMKTKKRITKNGLVFVRCGEAREWTKWVKVVKEYKLPVMK